MGEILDFYNHKTNIVKTNNVYSDNFTESAKILSNFIKNLPLSIEDNNKLIKMLVEHVTLMQIECYSQGFINGCNSVTEIKRRVRC